MGKQWQTIFLGSKITADGDCSHEIKSLLLLGRKVMTNLDSIFKTRDITLPTKVRLVKAMVFPVVMYGCESWTVKKTEHQRIDAFELWCWRRLLRVPWTARRSNQPFWRKSVLGVLWKGHEMMGPDAMIFVFWMLSFKPTFSLSSFTFIKRLFSSSSLSAIRVVSSAYEVIDISPDNFDSSLCFFQLSVFHDVLCI